MISDSSCNSACVVAVRPGFRVLINRPYRFSIVTCVANISGFGFFLKDIAEISPPPPRPPRSALDSPPSIPPRVPERSDNDTVLNDVKTKETR